MMKQLLLALAFIAAPLSAEPAFTAQEIATMCHETAKLAEWVMKSRLDGQSKATVLAGAMKPNNPDYIKEFAPEIVDMAFNDEFKIDPNHGKFIAEFRYDNHVGCLEHGIEVLAGVKLKEPQ